MIFKENETTHLVFLGGSVVTGIGCYDDDAGLRYFFS